MNVRRLFRPLTAALAFLTLSSQASAQSKSIAPVEESLAKTDTVVIAFLDEERDLALKEKKDFAPIFRFFKKRNLFKVVDQGTRELAEGREFGLPRCFCEEELSICFRDDEEKPILVFRLHQIGDEPSCKSASFAYVGSGVEKCSFNLEASPSSRREIVRICRELFKKHPPQPEKKN